MIFWRFTLSGGLASWQHTLVHVWQTSNAHVFFSFSSGKAFTSEIRFIIEKTFSKLEINVQHRFFEIGFLSFLQDPVTYQLG